MMVSEELSKQLNHQRVRQMLSDYIPDNEAKLLSNGRLTCMICQHRPIFDCVKTLSHHRTGKKHLAELGKYLKCKSEHEYQKLKILQKKEHKSKVMGKSEKSKPKYLKRKMALSSSTLFRCNPTCSPGKLDFPRIDNLDFVQPSAASQVRKYLKSIAHKNDFEKSLEQAKDSYGINKSHLNHSKSTNLIIKNKVSNLYNQHLSTEHTNYDNSKAEHELKLKMSGWLKDLSGNWIKNPDVEFDSDEDEPPPFNHCYQ